MGDYISFIFWSLTYLIVAIQFFYLKKKQSGNHFYLFPIIPCILNLSWEFISLLRVLHSPFEFSFVNNLVWLGLDFFILQACLNCLKAKFKKVYLLTLLPVMIAYWYLFKIAFWQGIIAYSMDVFMAIIFVVQAKKLYNRNIFGLLISVTKAIGNIGAFYHYYHFHPSIPYLGALTTLFDLLYIVIVASMLVKKEKQPHQLSTYEKIIMYDSTEFSSKKQQTVSQKKYSKGWQSTKKKYKKKK